MPLLECLGHSRISLDFDLTADDLVRWCSPNHSLPGKLLPAARAAQVFVGVILCYSLLPALDERPLAILVVLHTSHGVALHSSQAQHDVSA
jgi:hypothetical protein